MNSNIEENMYNNINKREDLIFIGKIMNCNNYL